MKRVIAVVLVSAPFVMQAQYNFTVKGSVGYASAPAKAYLLYKDGEKIVTDSALLTDGKFTIAGHIEEPTLARIIVDHKGVGFAATSAASDMKMMYLETGTIFIKSADSVKNAKFSGSPMNTEYAKFQSFMLKEQKAMDEFYANYRVSVKADTSAANMKRLEEGSRKVSEAFRNRQFEYIRANPDSYISLNVLRQAAHPVLDVAGTEPLFNGLSARLRQTKAGQEFKKEIELRRAVSVGQQAPAFTQNDQNDKPVHLADFKGKYVLLDFWASWCVPCRKENPYVVKAYNQFKDKDFTVVSVSLDRPGKKADWVAAIEKDGLTWTHVSDLQYWNNAVALLYGIKSVPQNFLIDREGKIVATDLRGEELSTTLEKFLK